MTDEPQQQPRNEPPRQHNRPQHRHYREQRGRSPASQQAPAPADTKETGTPGLDDADTEEDTAARQSQPRSHRGRPEKKRYEEWANDPYCN